MGFGVFSMIQWVHSPWPFPSTIYPCCHILTKDLPTQHFPLVVTM